MRVGLKSCSYYNKKKPTENRASRIAHCYTNFSSCTLKWKKKISFSMMVFLELQFMLDLTEDSMDKEWKAEFIFVTTHKQ